MNRIERTIVALSLVATGFFALTLAACGDPAAAGCRIDGDCRSGRICIARECVDKPIDGFDAGTTDGGSANVDPNGNPNGMPNGTPNGMPNGTPNNVTPGDAGMMDMGGMGTDAGMPDMGGQQDMNTTPVFGPQIEVSPGSIDFGFVPSGSSSDAPLIITNIGDDTLVLSSVALEASPSQGFSLSGPATMIAPGQSAEVTVTFSPMQAANFGNAVLVQSNDADDPEIRVPIQGRGFDSTFQTCLFSTPAQIDFGPVTPGQSVTSTITVGNCTRNGDVTFNAATIVGATPEFSVSSNAPVTLSPGDTETITVTFTPTALNPLSDTLRIESTAQLGGTTDIPIRGGGGCAESVALADLDGLGNDVPRPGPIAVVAGGRVNFDGANSTTPSGGAAYAWSVVSAPAGSTATLDAPTSVDTRFTPDVAGDYTIQLIVTDPNSGAPSCGPATVELTALANLPDLLLTLEWNADHDMDLHVLRDDGNGNFPAFEDPDNDLHFGALWLDWGVANDRTDDGYHLGDDSDGDGPENAAVAKLEAGRTYRVVAQFARPDGFQPAVFDADVTIDRRSMGPGMGTRTETRTFNLAERGLYWIVFDIDGSTGRITYVNRATQ